MATFSLTIETNNAAFHEGGPDAGAVEVSRILQVLSIMVERGAVTGNLIDYNGNAVGSFSWKGDES